MKLILREYLSSLKERGELDAVLPDLLSQMGLNVYSRPQRGTRQDGVDIGTVGSIDGGAEKVYLFSIKPGNLTRRDWSGDSPQSLRPSLVQIIDAYIPGRLPVEHRDKEIVICIAIGGDVQEQVRTDLAGFMSQNTKGKISFEEWNGDRIASYILANFLREDLLPATARSSLRKSLALLDEPDAAYRHFSHLITSLSSAETLGNDQKITAMRQMNICLGVLYAWANEAKNTESAYRSAELTLLHAWSIARHHLDQDTKVAIAIKETLSSIFSMHHLICSHFLKENVMPHVGKTHALSSATRGNCSLDINLKLFDLLGRLALDGAWAYWGWLRCPEDDVEKRTSMQNETLGYVDAVKKIILNNPVLLLPAKDDQAIDISIALSLLRVADEDESIKSWLGEMIGRCTFSYAMNRAYPTILDSYVDLLQHPKSTDSEYRQRANSASVLYPTIALWAGLLNDEEIYSRVSHLQRETLPYCTFQLWYPDDRSEAHFYKNTSGHGLSIANLSLNQTKEQFLEQIFQECQKSPQCRELSAVKFDWWPLVLMACRHYRFPVPLHLLEGLRREPDGSSS